MIDNRPISALSKGSLGSSCPIIMKHDFPNESRNYIDDIFQQVSSTKKRFRYDRPQTASIQQGMTKTFFQSDKQGQGRPQTAAVPQTQNKGLNSQELYSKLLQGKHQFNEDKFQIKPAKKLNTFQIHSALYKVKKQKEELDQKIHELEKVKQNFNETDFYLIANTGALDYIFNLQKNNNIPVILPEQLKKKQKTTSQIPRAVSAQSNKSRKSIKPDYLKDEIESRQPNEFEIIGNCCKMFKTQLGATMGSQDKEWIQKVDNNDPIKQSIEIQAKSMENINKLLQNKNQNEPQLVKKTDILDDEEEILDFVPIDFQSTKSSQQLKMTMGQQQKQMQLQQLQQYNRQLMEQQSQQQQFDVDQNFENIPNQQQMNNFFQGQTQSQMLSTSNKVLQTSNQQKMQRIQSAQSAKQINYLNSQKIIHQKMFDRSQTAQLRKGELHALMSYGPVPLIKERIIRNFDHLEILREAKRQEQIKDYNDWVKKNMQKDKKQLSISGQKVNIMSETDKNWQQYNNLAMDKYQDFDMKFSQDNQTIQSQNQQLNEFETINQKEHGQFQTIQRPQTAKSTNLKKFQKNIKAESQGTSYKAQQF